MARSGREAGGVFGCCGRIGHGTSGRLRPAAIAAITRSGRTRTDRPGSAMSAPIGPAGSAAARQTSVQRALPASSCRCLAERHRGRPPARIPAGCAAAPVRSGRTDPPAPARAARAVSTVVRPARMASSRTGRVRARGPAGSGSGCPAGPGSRAGPGRPVPGCSAPAFSRGVAVAARASRTGATRTAAASATRRTAAARSWPPVIAQPIMTAFFTIARACGRRSAS